MKNKFGKLLAIVLCLAAIPQVSSGFTNPLKSYDLYADTHTENSPTDNIMSQEYYTNESAKFNNSQKQPPATTPTSASGSTATQQGQVQVTVRAPQRRNDYLRESSKKVYGTGEGSWTQGPYCYINPTLKAIRWKYHISNFAGSLQESQAYVHKYPNDTLGYYYLAMSYAKCGDKENAIRAYEKVIALHDNPMIVKYATNGRNCVMGNQDEAKCFPDVNVPELKYPYKEIAKSVDLTPVDPQELINRNLSQLQNKLTPLQSQINAQAGNNNNSNNNGNGTPSAANTSSMPFANQDASLDRFINAPYGSGMSPELERQYKEQQLKNIQQEINKEDDNGPGKYFQNIRNIKNFDKESNAIDGTKLALANNNDVDVESFLNNPEYVKNKKELDEIKMMLGNSSDSASDITNMLPEIAKDGGNISPEVIQMMMMQSVMPNIIDIDSKNSF